MQRYMPSSPELFTSALKLVYFETFWMTLLGPRNEVIVLKLCNSIYAFIRRTVTGKNMY